MDNKYLIGIDVGTTSIKGVIIDNFGKLYATAGNEYTLETGGDDICEIDPEIYWIGTQKVIYNLLEKSKLPIDQIVSLAFSSQGETLICVDKNGTPLRKAITWLDNRSKKESIEITEKFGAGKIYKITGQPEVLPIWPATKILWLQKNEPDVFLRTNKFLMVADYLVFKLTGEYVTEESLVSSTLYYNFQEKIWWQEMLDFIGISSSQLPKVFKSGTKVTTIAENTAHAIGLSEKTLVVTGAYDHPAGAIGAGNITEGFVTETTGGAIAICITIDKPLLDIELNQPCNCHAVNNKYFLLPYGQTAGIVMQWFRDNFCENEIELATKENLDVYDLLTKMADAVPPGSDGLTMLPHLMGAGSPEFDAKSKGIFYGVTLNTKRGHFIRAIMESIACIVKANIDLVMQKGFPVNEIRVLGGGAKSTLWNQIKADMLGIPVVTLKIRETPSLGAAILAGVGSGVFKSIREGCDKVVEIDKKFIPNPVNKEVYEQVYKRYCSLYELNKPLWNK